MSFKDREIKNMNLKTDILSLWQSMKVIMSDIQEELKKEELAPEDISTVKEFEKMLQEEEWREVT